MSTKLTRIKSITGAPSTGLDLIEPAKGIGFSQFQVAAHDYAAGTTAWTATDKENLASVIEVTNAGGAANAIFEATDGKILYVMNTSGATITVKPSGEPGVAVPNGASALLCGNGTDFKAVAPASGGAGSFTTLAASGNVTLSPTGTVAISPSSTLTMAPVGNASLSPSAGTTTLSGTGNMTVAPTGTLAITPTGNTSLSPSAGTTTISGTGAVTIGPTGALTLSPSTTLSVTPTGALTINPTAASTMDNVAVGGTTPAAGSFTTIKRGALYPVSHSYGGAGSAWTLTTDENLGSVFTCTNSNANVDAVATATSGKSIIVYNNTGHVLTWKASGQTGVAIPNGRTMFLRANGTDFIQANDQWLSGYLDGVIIGATTPAAGAFTGVSIAGSGSGATAIAAAAAASGTLTLPAATDTVVGRATTDTLTNKTLTDFINSGAKRCTAQVDRTSSTTLTAITGLAVALTAAGVYTIQAYIPGTATVNGGAKFALANGDTLTATSMSYTGRHMNGATINAVSTTTSLGTAVGAATAVLTHAMIEGVIVVNAAGTLVVQIAQNFSHGDTTSAYVNGYLIVTRIA